MREYYGDESLEGVCDTAKNAAHNAVITVDDAPANETGVDYDGGTTPTLHGKLEL